jgi:hypothetical protein
MVVQAGQGKKQDPVSKITRAKRARGVAQTVEDLPSKCKALKFKPQYTPLPKKRKIDQNK